LLIPPPLHLRSDIQQQEIRDLEIPPSDYYPEGYKPELITEWPTDKPFFIPNEVLNR
jgi:ribonuclease Z